MSDAEHPTPTPEDDAVAPDDVSLDEAPDDASAAPAQASADAPVSEADDEAAAPESPDPSAAEADAATQEPDAVREEDEGADEGAGDAPEDDAPENDVSEDDVSEDDASEDAALTPQDSQEPDPQDAAEHGAAAEQSAEAPDALSADAEALDDALDEEASESEQVVSDDDAPALEVGEASDEAPESAALGEEEASADRAVEASDDTASPDVSEPPLGQASSFERGSGASLSVGFSKGERLSQRIQALKRETPAAAPEALPVAPEDDDLLGLPRPLRQYKDPERDDVLHIDGFVVRVRDEVKQFDKRALYGDRLGTPPRLFKVGVSIDGSGAHTSSERARLLLVDMSGDPNVVRDIATVLDALERQSITQSMPQAVDHWTVEGAELLLMSDHLQGCAAIHHAQWRAFPLEDALEILIQLAMTLATVHDAGYALGRLNIEDVLWSAEQRRVAINQLTQLIPLVELNSVSQSTVIQRDIEALGEGLLEVASGRALEATRPWFERDDVTDVLVQHGLGRPGLTQVLLGALGSSLEGRYTSMRELIDGLLQIRVEMRRPLVVRVGMGSSVGNHPMRRKNQDSCGVAETQVTYHGQRQHIGLYCVADGVGGEEAGEWASQVAVSSAMAAFHRMLGAYGFDAIHSNVTGMARALVKAAAQRLAIAGEVEPEVHRGATTFTALLIAGDRAGVAHIGDSRACLLRGGHLVQLTRDHNFARIRIALGELSEDEVCEHPEDARRLTRFLDTASETPLAWIDGYNPALLADLIQPQRAEPATFQGGGFDLFFQPFQRTQRAEKADWTPLPEGGSGEYHGLHQVDPNSDQPPTSSSERSIFDAAQEEDARVGHLALAPGDRIVLMSDGVYNELPDDALRRCLSHGDPEICVQRIIQSALSTIALDNVGLVVVACERLSPNLVLARGSLS